MNKFEEVTGRCPDIIVIYYPMTARVWLPDMVIKIESQDSALVSGITFIPYGYYRIKYHNGSYRILGLDNHSLNGFTTKELKYISDEIHNWMMDRVERILLDG